ncbi:MAG: sulfotransferase [Alphaproteobacteria bacterium]|nr:sulfotransferase [Alphaproteobacteria bacterium]
MSIPPLGRATPSAEALDRLVYLVGPARGGTSIINKCLGLHPRALGLPSLTYFVNRAWRYRHRVDERTWLHLYRNPISSVLSTLDPDGARTFGRLVATAFRRKRFAELYRLYPMVYALRPEADRDPAALRCWHDKSNNWRGLWTIKRALPAARFVFVTRDPRAVALSHAGRVNRRRRADPDAPIDHAEIIRACLYWRMMMLMLIWFAHRHRDAVIWVRYEDFVADPVAELNRLYAFSVSEALPQDDVAALIRDVVGGATNRPEETYRGISATPAARWRDQLGPPESALIEALTGPMARRLGYAMERPSAGVVAKAIWALPGVRERLDMAARIVIGDVLERIVPGGLAPSR